MTQKGENLFLKILLWNFRWDFELFGHFGRAKFTLLRTKKVRPASSILGSSLHYRAPCKKATTPSHVWWGKNNTSLKDASSVAFLTLCTREECSSMASSWYTRTSASQWAVSCFYCKERWKGCGRHNCGTFGTCVPRRGRYRCECIPGCCQSESSPDSMYSPLLSNFLPGSSMMRVP